MIGIAFLYPNIFSLCSGIPVSTIAVIALIGVLSTKVNTSTSLTTVTNETFDISVFKNLVNVSDINTTYTKNLTNVYETTDWQYNDCPMAVTSLAMDNGTLAVVTTNYIVGTNGEINLTSSALWWTQTMNNETLITYTYCADEYLDTQWNRTVIRIIPGFFAIALLMASLALFYSVAKETGII